MISDRNLYATVVDPPLPRCVRSRLRRDRRIDDAGYWLVCHHRFRMAELLWRLTGRW